MTSFPPPSQPTPERTPEPEPTPPVADGWYDRARGMGWGGAIALVIAVLVVIGSFSEGDDGPSANEVDSTELFFSVSDSFVNRYTELTGAPPKLGGDSTTCYDDEGAYECELSIDIPVVSDEQWDYKVTLEGECWTATTYQEYGPYQGSIESYQKDEVLAPPTDVAARMADEADGLRKLKGCVENQAAPTEQEDGSDFIATFASMRVEREFGSKPSSTTCSFTGMEEGALTPDSAGYDCEAVMPDGQTYIDSITCFDHPPFENYDSCGGDEGYPRLPLRAVP